MSGATDLAPNGRRASGEVMVIALALVASAALIWVFSYEVGSILLKVDAATVVAPVSTTLQETQFDQALQWLTGATLVTAFGLVIVAIVSSAVSYLVAGWAWRVWIGRKRSRHLAHRARRVSPAE